MNAIQLVEPSDPIVAMIRVEDISPHPDNPRTFPGNDADNLSLVELAESIRAVGLLEPVLLRPLKNPGGAESYQLVAGERRWRACCLAGLDEIPAIVRVLDDVQTLEVLITENLQREDLSPLEEARGVRALVDRAGWTVDDVADRLGRSKFWVAQRARLCNLSERWRAEVADPNSLISEWPVALLVQVARLEPAAQDELGDRARYFVGNWIPRPGDVVRAVANLTRKVRSAPWKSSDAALHPDAGACDDCLKRSSRHPGLFEEDEDQEKAEKNDRCLDSTCWGEKLRRHLVAREAELREEHKDLVLLNGQWDGGTKRDDAVESYNTSTVKKSTPGARPALVVTGADAGSIHWVTVRGGALVRGSGVDGKPAPKTLAEKRAQLTRRRQAKAVELLRADIEAIAPYPRPRGIPNPEMTVLLPLVAVFGTQYKLESSQYCPWLADNAEVEALYKHPQAAWKRADELSHSSKTEEIFARLWSQVKAVLLARLQYLGTQTDMKKLWKDAELAAGWFDLDIASAAAAAIAAIPEPKSWPKGEGGAADDAAFDQVDADEEPAEDAADENLDSFADEDEEDGGDE